MATENIPSRLHCVAEGNVVAGANEILDDDKGKKQTVINQENDQRLETLETAVGTGGSVDSRIESAKTEIVGGASSDCNTLGKAEALISTNANDIAALQEAYAALTQNDVVVVAPADTWPVATPAQNIIYRVVDRTNTPPQYYADYMWNGTVFVEMARYNNAIDARPKKSSQNLVTSGGVFDNMGALDVSELNATENPHTLAKYVDLSAALAAVPTDYQKGGMSIKFVQTSDNKYVQYRLMADDWSTTVTDWQGVEGKPAFNSKNLVDSNGVWEQGKELSFRTPLYITQDDLISGEWTINGTIQKSANVKRTDFIKLSTGMGLIVLGKSYRKISFFSEPSIDSFIDSFYFASINGTSDNLPSNAKYCVINFANGDPGDYNDLIIRDLYDLNQDLKYINFGAKYWACMYKSLSSNYLNGLIYSFNNTVAEIYGSAIDTTKYYSLEIGYGSIVFCEDSVEIGRIQNVQSGVVDITISNNDNTKNCRIKGYIANTTDTTGTDFIRFTDNCFVPSLVDTENIYKSIDEIDTRVDNIENSDIFLDDMRLELIDLSEYWGDAEQGGINYTNGEKQVTYYEDCVCSPFIPCDGYEMVSCPNMPVGRNTATCFYDKDKNPIQYVQGMIIYGAERVGVTADVCSTTMLVPDGAYYFRTSKLATAGTELTARKYRSDTYKSIENRSGNVLFGFENFSGITKSRQSYTQSTESYSVKQIKCKEFIQLSRFRYESVVKAGSDLYLGIGLTSFLNTTELTVDGNSVKVMYYGQGGDTYPGAELTAVITETLPFTITSGELYKVAIQKLDYTIEENLPMFGALFEVERMSDGTKWSRSVKRAYYDSSTYNGVTSDSFCVLSGVPFVSIKRGTAQVYSVNFMDSQHSVHPLIAMLGDSYSQSSTLIEIITPHDSDNMRFRYTGLLENAIGHDKFVLTGLGGDCYSAERMSLIKNYCRLYNPSYFFCQMSCNSAGRPYVPKIHIFEIQHLVDWMHKHGITPILSTIPTVSTNHSEGRAKTFTDEVNAYVRTCGERYIDIQEVMLSAGAYPNSYYSVDGTHPNEDGHKAIYDAFVRELPELFYND